MLKSDIATNYETRIQQLEAENQRLLSELVSLKYKEVQDDASYKYQAANRPSKNDITSFFKLQRTINSKNTERINSVFTNYPFAVFKFTRTNNSYILENCNKKGLEITDHKIKAVLGADVSKLWNESPELIYLLDLCYHQKSIKYYQGTYTFRSSQKAFHIQATYGFIKENTIYVLVEDISEEYRANSFLSESEKQFELFINASPDIYCIKDGEGRWQLANKEILKVFKLSKSYKGKTNIQLARNNETFRAAFAFCQETDEFAWKRKKISHIIERIPGRNGEILYYDVNKIPLFKEDGSRKMLIVQGRNITDRILAEDILKNTRSDARLNELKLKRLLSALPDTLFTIRKDGIILNIQNGNKFFHTTDESSIPNRLENLIPGQAADTILNALNRVVHNEIVSPFSVDIEIYNEKHYYEVRLVKQDDSTFILILRNLSELKAKNEELFIAKTKAEESDKLKSAFIANLSHEIRTPLNGIVGFSEMLAKQNLESSKRIKFAEIITRSSKQLLKILHDLLDISKFDAGSTQIALQAFNLNVVFDEMYHIFKKQCVCTVKLTYASGLAKEMSDIISDKHRIIQLISIFLSNAVKYTSSGNIDFGYTVKDKKLTLYFIDTGIGIAAEYHDKIFDRFFQEPSNRIPMNTGTGVGLSLAKRIVELMNGSISLVSTPHVGSTFYLTIPYTQPEKET